MDTSLVLTVLGPDRPGLVEAVSSLVAAHGANWEESHMARLGGRFAGILRVQVAEERAAGLEASLRGLAPQGLTVVVERSAPEDAREGWRGVTLDLVGQDRPGIVRQISQALASRGVSVDELETRCESAAMAGGMLFRASAHLRVPPAVPLDELRGALEALAADLMVDLVLDES